MTEHPVPDSPKPRHVVPGSASTITPRFASAEAADLWEEAGRPALGTPSGKTGHTVADVKAATEED